jgi:hypothetical protein
MGYRGAGDGPDTPMRAGLKQNLDGLVHRQTSTARPGPSPDEAY